MPSPLSQPPGRILIIKPSAIGDVVHSLPVLNLLRKHHPKAHIAWLVTPACAGILQNHPQLDELILFDRKRYAHLWRSVSAIRAFRQLTRDLRQRQFDLVLDLQGLFRSGYLARATGAPIRVGFANAREGAPWFYTHKVRIDNVEQHAVDRYLTLAEFIGLPRGPVEYVFPTTDADRQAVEAKLGRIGDFALLLPGTNWLTKRWPVEHFADLAHRLREEYRLKIVTAGSPAEAELAGRIPADLHLAGKTTLTELVALIERASLVVCNDSGPMHIAAALSRPMLALFGPTNPVRTGPYNAMDSVLRLEIPCSPCYSRKCSHQSCLQQLLPEQVVSYLPVRVRERKSSGQG